jgi:hypothetical protein
MIVSPSPYATANKKPRGVSGGASFSFLSKEAIANSVAGNRLISNYYGFRFSCCCYFSSGV